MLEFGDFSRAHQVFDEMLGGAFIRLLVQLTCAERWGQLSSIGGADG